jgi:hypothetical protein
MRHRAPWDAEQVLTVKRLRQEGVTDEEIAYFMGRTVAGLRRAMVRYFGEEARIINHGYVVGPPIGRTMECTRLERDATIGSQVLAQAVNNLINSMKPEVVAECLGTQRSRVAGTERVFKTCSAERLAA